MLRLGVLSRLSPRVKLGISFLLFGLINNVLYVVILSAALDLVPATTPKGIIAFCNIAPSLLVKVVWPYITYGAVQYGRRIAVCCASAVFGMLIVASFESVTMRLLGICCASFASGLGEMTFLQLSTIYRPPSIAGHSVGYFASGTGAAGLVGAFLWWELRSLGVKTGARISAVLPFVNLLVYLFFLPSPDVLKELVEEDDQSGLYTSVATEDTEGVDNVVFAPNDLDATPAALSMREKWEIAKPLLLRFMFPLLLVYLFEYIINQGVAPTLIYPVPSSGILKSYIASIRDYYPLWQLIYQTGVFLSRSSLSFGLPPLPGRLMWLPAFVQGVILTTLSLESASDFLGPVSNTSTVWLVIMIISLEGICGGLAYVNTYHHVNQLSRPATVRGAQEKEFAIASIGLSDSSGILLASLLAVPTELALCSTQVARGRTWCRDI